MFGLLSPPLCYPEKLAVAQSAQGPGGGNVISVIKRAALETLARGLAAGVGRSAAAGPQVPARPLPPGRRRPPEGSCTHRAGRGGRGGRALVLAGAKGGGREKSVEVGLRPDPFAASWGRRDAGQGLEFGD